MRRKGKTIVPFLLNALNDNKYPEYLKYTDKENGIFCLILPRMSKNIKEKDMKLLKDWYADENFDYKAVKQSAILALKRPSNDVELLYCKNSEYTFRILQPEVEVPVREFIPVEWKLGSLRNPIEYISLITKKRSGSELLSYVMQLTQNLGDKSHPNSKRLIASHKAYRKSVDKVFQETSTKGMVKMFQKLTLMQRVLESHLCSHLNVQSFLQQLFKVKKVGGYPISGFLRNKKNLKEWKKQAPKVKIVPEEIFKYKRYSGLEAVMKSMPRLSEKEENFQEFLEKLYLVNDESFQEILNLNKQSLESASLIEEIQDLMISEPASTSSDKEDFEDKYSKKENKPCILHELLFTPEKDDVADMSRADIMDRISVLSEELNRVSISNRRKQKKLVYCVGHGLENQRVKKQIEEVSESIVKTYAAMLSDDVVEKELSDPKYFDKLALNLAKGIKKKQMLTEKEKFFSQKYVDEDEEDEIFGVENIEMLDEDIKKKVMETLNAMPEID